MTIRALSFGAVAASMIAYFAAQLIDVHVFHLVKRLTGGRMLWLRNNASTLVSQFVDTFAVITITHFYAKALPIDDTRATTPATSPPVADRVTTACWCVVPTRVACSWRVWRSWRTGRTVSRSRRCPGYRRRSGGCWICCWRA